MAELLKEYALANCDFTMDGISMNSGVGADAVFTATREFDMITTESNANGDNANSRNVNKLANIEFTLMKNSTVNAQLLARYLLQEEGGVPFYPSFSVKDPSDPIACVAAQCWFVKQPDLSKSNTAGEQTWTLRCHALQLVPTVTV